MYGHERQSKIVDIIEAILDLVKWLLYVLVWIPISFIFKLIVKFIKDVLTGVYGKLVQVSVVAVFGYIVYLFQSLAK
jgi:TctA family transporter